MHFELFSLRMPNAINFTFPLWSPQNLRDTTRRRGYLWHIRWLLFSNSADSLIQRSTSLSFRSPAKCRLIALATTLVRCTSALSVGWARSFCSASRMYASISPSSWWLSWSSFHLRFRCWYGCLDPRICCWWSGPHFWRVASPFSCA